MTRDLPISALLNTYLSTFQASRKPVTSLSIIDVDNSTGWPWYAANLPPTDFYDCLFIFYSCTDFEEPGMIVSIVNNNLDTRIGWCPRTG